MCLEMGSHFHVSNCKEGYIKHLAEQPKMHSFARDGVLSVIPSPHAHLIESGKVQGVHYLSWAREQAKLMSINGWIRNVKDGSVEAVLSGKPVAVDRMLDLCKTGPGYAKVEEIEAEACDPPPGAGFQQLPDFDPAEGPSKEITRKPKPSKRETSKFKLKKSVMLGEST